MALKSDLQAKVFSLRAQKDNILNTVEKEKRSSLTSDEMTKLQAIREEHDNTTKQIDEICKWETETRAANPTVQQIQVTDDLNATNPLGVSERDLSRYSLLRAIRSMVENGGRLDGLEGELSKEMEKRTGKTPRGFYMYTGATSAIEARAARQLMERRDLTSATAPGALNVVTLNQSFIELLRHQTLIDKVGATYLAGLQGSAFYLPRQSGASTAYWLAEEGAPTQANQTFDNVTISPKTVGAYTVISRQLLKESSLDIEGLVRSDIARVLALAIDAAAFNGTGSSNQPLGILQNTANIVPTVLASDTGNGRAAAWSDVVGLETTVAAGDALLNTPCYVTNPKQKGKLKGILRSSVAGAKYIFDVDNPETPVNGYPCLVSNNIPSNLTKGSGTGLSPIIFGDFSSMIVALFGGLDIVVDPFTQSTSGSIVITGLQTCDIELRHYASFADVTACTN